MGIPDLTHLQFLVLDVIGAKERPGKYVREKLTSQGERKTLPAFYQMMARLEDAKFVEGSYRKIEVGGQQLQERWYRITASGIRAWQATRDFYIHRAAVGMVSPTSGRSRDSAKGQVSNA